MIVYMATDTVTGKRYVGATTASLKRRKSQHELAASPTDSRPFMRALAERTGDFVWSVVAQCETRELMQLAEMEAIHRFKTHVSHGGYNVKCSGAPGLLASADTRAKLSRAKKGIAPTAKCLAKAHARRLDPDVRAKIKEAMRSREWPDRKIPREDYEAILRQRAAKVSLKTIATQYGCTKSGLKNYLRRLGAA